MASEKEIASQELATFRDRVKRVRNTNREGWETTKKLLAGAEAGNTLSKLIERIEQSSLSRSLQMSLTQSLKGRHPGQIDHSSNEQLKVLTGLPAAKAIRSLCLMFDVLGSDAASVKVSRIPSSRVEEALGASLNPYDLLLAADFPSLFDVGAGDLTFEQELVDQYLPKLRERKRSLILHALDRLQPGSQYGGVYHANQERKTYLQGFPEAELQFRFWGGMNLVDPLNIKGILPYYTIVTCHAPANPTFALEPTRLSQGTIQEHLTKTKGEFRKARIGGEEVLEVHHEGRVLEFPPWKFDIVGPLALLDAMTRLGGLCVLSSMDGEVFWETLSQLLEGELYRPNNVVFSPDNLHKLFGEIYTQLTQLPIGGRVPLSEIAEVRRSLRRILKTDKQESESYRLRYVEVRRGAIFDGVPAGFTARQFPHMKEEASPWWLILIPE